MMNNMGSESSLLGAVLKGPPVRRAIKSTADYDTAQRPLNYSLNLDAPTTLFKYFKRCY